MPSQPHKSYVRAAVRGVLGLRPCACGCNFIETRRGLVDWSKLGRIGRWATRSEGGD